MVKIIHISDLHFGRTNERALSGLKQAINSEQADLVVITGDLTQSGRRREFQEAGSFLGSLESRVLSVPGNHDTPVYNLGLRFFKPWARYEAHVGDASVQCVNAGPVSVIGLNSARRAQPRLNWSFGHLSRSAIRAANEIAQTEADAGRQVLLAMHHPVTLGPGTAGSRIVGNGELALEAFSKTGVSAILTGHVHVASAAPIAATGGKILSIQAGTAMSTRERGEQPSFGLLSVRPSEMVLETRRLSGDVFITSGTQSFLKSNGAWQDAKRD